MYGETRRAFAATTRISRKDFGLTWNKLVEAGPAVGDEVTIALDLEDREGPAEVRVELATAAGATRAGPAFPLAGPPLCARALPGDPSPGDAPASHARGRRGSGPEHLQHELAERDHLARHVLRRRRDDVQAARGPLELRDDPDERAGDHVRLRHEGRQEPDPDARPHGVPHEQEVVADDPRSALRGRPHGGDPQLLGAAAEHDPVMLVQLFRAPRRPRRAR